LRVFKVRDVSSGRFACLKMFHDLISRADLECFQYRLKTLDSLRHPNLVQVYHCGVRGDWIYLVQEFVPGGSLRRRIGHEPQPIRASAVLVESLARTMQFVHEHGLVHGNLEPANVLLGDDGSPRIAEVGLVNQPRGPSPRPGETIAPSYRISRKNVPDFVGNPRYLAPEVIFLGPVGPHTDVYGLGAVLYHLLTGRPPFDGASVHELLVNVMNVRPVPPRQLRPDVPAELQAICLRCLDHRVHERYPSAQALAEELGRFRAGKPLTETRAGESQALVTAGTVTAPPVQAAPGNLWRRVLQWLGRRGSETT
jgi:serine/threonine-protein kinase